MATTMEKDDDTSIAGTIAKYVGTEEPILRLLFSLLISENMFYLWLSFYEKQRL